MTGPEHYRAAELLIKQANSIMDGFPSDAYAQTLAEAQVHATLAHAAAIALPGEHVSDWQREIWAFGPETGPGPEENDPGPEVDEAPEHGPPAMRRFMREHPLTPGGSGIPVIPAAQIDAEVAADVRRLTSDAPEVTP